jgi:ABC-type branched-subunit amino acid transport system ATPase component
VIFDESKMRTRRLGVINSLTTSISRAQQYGPMLATAMEQLKDLMLAKAAWFRLQEDGKMVIVQQIGRTIGALKAQGFTILLVEQNFHFAATVADRYYVMEHGQIVDQFANSELKTNMAKLHDYLGV